MKRSIILIGLAIIFIIIAFLFWHNELVYSLPTPIPKNYKAVTPGNIIQIPVSLHRKDNKPVFLHFFNPDCPCSKFNISHFKSLVKQYSSEATFAIVVMNNESYIAAPVIVSSIFIHHKNCRC